MWRTIDNRAEFMNQPIHQFIRLEGKCHHDGALWERITIGTATIDRHGPFGYRREDITRLCQDSDMEFNSAKITHWMPATYPPLSNPIKSKKFMRRI